MVDWDESCSVKVVRFDDDHKQMFSLINKLHLAMLSGKGALAVQETVTHLSDHAQGHFAGEEALMEKTKFMAERVGFEPTIPVKVCPLSRRIVSTTHAPLRMAGDSLSGRTT
jgi:hypothetical protein